MKTSKQRHNLRYFFNCPGSPDTNLMGKAWKGPAMAIRDVQFQDKNLLVEAARQAWKELQMGTSNA